MQYFSAYVTRGDIASTCLIAKMPIIVGNQWERVFARDGSFARVREAIPYDNYNGWRFTSAEASLIQGWNGDNAGGDGGSPYWIVVNGQLVIIGHVTWLDGGAFYAFNVDLINQAIGNLALEIGAPADYVQTVDLSAFPDL